MAKPKISSDWLASCAGCHMSLLDVDERIVAIAEQVEFRATPITDFKEPDEEGVDVGILTGAVNTTANEEVAHRMRKRCKILVSMGDCAVFGGVIAMRNLFDLNESLRRAYVDTESTDEDGKVPQSPELGVPTKVRAVKEVVDVDLSIPGCPPDADIIFYALNELANGRIPKIEDDKIQWH